MAILPADAAARLEGLNNTLYNKIYTGSRYLILSGSDYGQLASAEISKIDIGASGVEMLGMSSLSNHQRFFPTKYTPGQITLSGATVFNTALYQLFFGSESFVKTQTLNPPAHDIIIFMYSADGSLLSPIPLAVLVAEKCVAVSWQPSASDANGESVPLETIVLQPYNLYRVSGKLTEGI